MVWRRFAIRIPLILCLLCSTCVFAKKKPPAQPVNINTANSEQLQTVPGIGPATADKILQMRKSYGAFKSVDDLLAIQRGRFAGDSWPWPKAPRKNAQVFSGGETQFQEYRASTGLFRLRKTQGATRKIAWQGFDAASGTENGRGRRRATVVRAPGEKQILRARVGGEKVVLAVLGMAGGRGCRLLGHRVWWVGLGWSMRNGTWSAMRMP